MKSEIEDMTGKREKLEELFRAYGFLDFKWIDPKNIIVSQWVRMKCLFGCKHYGRNCCCPPNVPSVSACERFFHEYRTLVAFHFKKRMDNRNDRHNWYKEVNRNLSELERTVFLSGYEKTFLLFMNYCNICTECVEDRKMCRKPKIARPTPEALAVDVFSTVRQYGFHIEVCMDDSREMDRFAFLLIE